MKIRIGTPEAIFTVPGTISRPQLLPTDRDSEHLMRAVEFEAEIRPCRVEDAPGTIGWGVRTLTIRGPRIVRRRTTEAWASRRFYHPLEFTDSVPATHTTVLRVYPFGGATVAREVTLHSLTRKDFGRLVYRAPYHNPAGRIVLPAQAAATPASV
ncbi:hypothetical protein ACIQF5_20510 [Streptomyces goshikiensis]|uniref:hypothetical protein n=1 Tax=Streptomyces goshikiensis TaxID=1942 RepID=UPI003820909C